jgi:hypothetical protein
VVDALRWLFADHHGTKVEPQRRQPEYEQIAAAPQRYAGLEIRIGYALVRRLTAAGFDAEVHERSVPVVGSAAGLRPGAIVSLRGEVLPDGRIRLLETYLHPRRRTKWLVSGSTALLVAALGASWYWQARRGRTGEAAAARGDDA